MSEEPGFTLEQHFELRKIEAASKHASRDQLEEMVLIMAKQVFLQKQLLKQWMKEKI